jgi:hypothetical protein
MTNVDLSPSPAPSLSLIPAQGALYFRCTGHQVFWGKVRRSAQEAACTRAFPSFTRAFPSQIRDPHFALSKQLKNFQLL